MSPATTTGQSSAHAAGSLMTFFLYSLLKVSTHACTGSNDALLRVYAARWLKYAAETTTTMAITSGTISTQGEECALYCLAIDNKLLHYHFPTYAFVCQEGFSL